MISNNMLNTYIGRISFGIWSIAPAIREIKEQLALMIDL
jgi:hypothetical protein